ncbi:hypothetical protein ACVILH_005274 [Bradyrhizobium sp. USDA 4353]
MIGNNGNDSSDALLRMNGSLLRTVCAWFC